MTKPVFSTGDVPSAGQVNDWFVNTLFVRKSADEGVTASTTLQNDNDLVLTLGVGTWEIEAELSAICSSGVAADIKLVWTFSGTTTGSPGRYCLGPQLTSTDASNTLMKSASHSFGFSVPYGVEDAIGNYMQESMSLVVTVAGVLQLQWAQNGASASTTTMLAGSRLRAIRVD